MPLRGQGNLAARRARATLEVCEAGRSQTVEAGQHRPLARKGPRERWLTISLTRGRRLSTITGPTSVMRHPQDDLLIVGALVALARGYSGTPTEDYALELADEIADHHGLTVTESIRHRVDPADKSGPSALTTAGDRGERTQDRSGVL